ncbi:MAG: pyruvate, phosphate dikinase/phosphoenolpyruvate synthase regulator [Gammaproteobacteria bacterium]|nr:pyruvate, phosphate dikinase/phosphoenolpyruvate synthase regulator [Gammaproteobacteria bacterium]
MQRDVFLLSDHTGITIEAMARSLLSQFDQCAFVYHRIPYLQQASELQTVVTQVNSLIDEGAASPLVFSTISDAGLRQTLSTCKALSIDLFDTFIPGLQAYLDVVAEPAVGQLHAVGKIADYNQRMRALDFALKVDDGESMHCYVDADIILLGVSRSGKTPVSLFMALHSGLQVANYPLVDKDLDRECLVDGLREYKAKILVLMISAERLHEIRAERFPHSRYASLKQCKRELSCLTELCRLEQLPMLDVTHQSVEEISTHILHGFYASL